MDNAVEITTVDDEPGELIVTEYEALGMIVGLLIDIRDELRRANVAAIGEDLGDLP